MPDLSAKAQIVCMIPLWDFLSWFICFRQLSQATQAVTWLSFKRNIWLGTVACSPTATLWLASLVTSLIIGSWHCSDCRYGWTTLYVSSYIFSFLFLVGLTLKQYLVYEKGRCYPWNTPDLYALRHHCLHKTENYKSGGPSGPRSSSNDGKSSGCPKRSTTSTCHAHSNTPASHLADCIQWAATTLDVQSSCVPISSHPKLPWISIWPATRCVSCVTCQRFVARLVTWNCLSPWHPARRFLCSLQDLKIWQREIGVARIQTRQQSCSHSDHWWLEGSEVHSTWVEGVSGGT